MISPHFPPDTSAGTHRARLLSAHLGACGWEPTVLTVDPRDYETRLDRGLLGLVPDSVRVVRVRAWPASLTRRVGIGDLGLRALSGLWCVADRLVAREPYDLVYITTYPVYPALLGPRLKRRHRVPFVLDLQDPWVGSWGKTVGPGRDGATDLKSRASRLVGAALETAVTPRADAITAVSRGTFDELSSRVPAVRGTPFLELPIGGDASDVDHISALGGANRLFDPADGLVHVCSVGTVLPRGIAGVEAVVGAVAQIRERRPDMFARLRLHFVGTSNLTATDAPLRVMPIAAASGVAGIVAETPARVDYLDALAIQRDAAALLLVGSDEPHYTASKIYPALMVNRPIVAVYHRASSVVDILRRAGDVPPMHVITFEATAKTPAVERAIAAALIDAAEHHGEGGRPRAADRLGDLAAPALAARFASFLESLPVLHASA